MEEERLHGAIIIHDTVEALSELQIFLLFCTQLTGDLFDFILHLHEL